MAALVAPQLGGGGEGPGAALVGADEGAAARVYPEVHLERVLRLENLLTADVLASERTGISSKNATFPSNMRDGFLNGAGIIGKSTVHILLEFPAVVPSVVSLGPGGELFGRRLLQQLLLVHLEVLDVLWLRVALRSAVLAGVDELPLVQQHVLL